MKKYLLLFFLTSIFGKSFSQNIFPATGSVGIGTSSPSSSVKLDIRGGLSAIGSESQFSNFTFVDPIPGTGYTVKIGGGGLAVRGASYFLDNVGLGIANPTAKLEITGGPVWTTNGWVKSVKLQSGAAVQLSAANAKFGFGATDNDGLFFFSSPTDDVSQSASYIMSMRANGNVGIGVLNATEKLSVKGKIRAQEVKVEMNGWSDFVFAKDYALPTLAETEKHIKEKGHLQGIPSAAEVEKSGIELGDMNKKLLQKIEELTLYLIEMKKENEKITVVNKEYEKRLQRLESRIR